MSRAISAAPASDRAPAVSSQISQVLPLAVARRERSISSQLGSPLMVKPTHRPVSPLTLPATMVPGPRRSVSSSVRRAPRAEGGSTSK